jgi:hypothetical protein
VPPPSRFLRWVGSKTPYGFASAGAATGWVAVPAREAGRIGIVSVCTVDGIVAQLQIEHAVDRMRHAQLGSGKLRRHIGCVLKVIRGRNRHGQEEIRSGQRAGLCDVARTTQLLESGQPHQSSQRQPVAGHVRRQRSLAPESAQRPRSRSGPADPRFPPRSSRPRASGRRRPASARCGSCHLPRPPPPSRCAETSPARLSLRKKTNRPSTGTSSGLPRCTGEGVSVASSCMPLLSSVICGRGASTSPAPSIAARPSIPPWQCSAFRGSRLAVEPSAFIAS